MDDETTDGGRRGAPPADGAGHEADQGPYRQDVVAVYRVPRQRLRTACVPGRGTGRANRS